MGGRTIAEWQEVMTSGEFCDWQNFYKLQPFGPYRADLQAGIVASTVANVYAKKGTHYTPKDFMPKFTLVDQPREAMSPDEIMTRFRQLTGGRG